MSNLTLSLDEETLRAAKIYAATHNTSISQIVRKHLAELTGTAPTESHDREAVLRSYSRGRLGRKEAMDLLDVDYGTLILLLSEANLPLPRVSDEEARSMANKLIEVWRSNR